MRIIFTLLLFIFSFITPRDTYSQLNGYARVTAMDDEMLILSNVNENYGSFTPGQEVIIMQMQDNVIGTNTDNDEDFGKLSQVRSAGLYEIAQVASVSRPGGILNSIQLNNAPGNAYRFNANSSVQIITFPKLGNPNYTTTANMTSLPWNGNIGGVLAFRVSGTLTLDHSINVNGKGFRGGTTNGGGSAECGDATRYRASAQDNYGNKGEGIYKSTNTGYAAGRGRIINGGGGGNSHNAGGGGGGNYSGGGTGGPGWVCSPGMGGLGGIVLQSFITSQRIFMGGGGGAGEANDGNHTQGGSGGGIIFIQASTIRTSGTGDTIRISSNGDRAINGTNDGVGGAGAGGSVVFMVNNWDVPASKPLLVTANGGDGGDVLHADQHGGGGGGGQGTIINILSAFDSHIAATTLNGHGGLNNINGTRAGNGTGPDNAGVIGLPVLPIKLVYFTGNFYNQQVQLQWKINNGTNNSYYEVQRSGDGINFTVIGVISSRVNNDDYSFVDAHPLQAASYYRIRIAENNGSSSYSKTILIKKDMLPQTGISIFPNPVANTAYLHLQGNEKGSVTIEVIDMNGKIIEIKQFPLSTGANTIVLEEVYKMKPGVYAIKATIGGNIYMTRMIVQ